MLLYISDKEAVTLQDFDEKDADKFSFEKRGRAASSRKRKDSYDYQDTMQLLGTASAIPARHVMSRDCTRAITLSHTCRL